MLATVSHSPVWRSSGFVCVACRRQQQQRRWNSQVHHISTAASSDSWFDTLNDISDNFGTPPPKPKAKAQPERQTKANAPKTAKPERDDHFNRLKQSLAAKVVSSPGTRPQSIHSLRQLLHQSTAAVPKSHQAKRKQRRALGERARKVTTNSGKPGTLLPDDLLGLLKREQEEKAAEDDERLSRTTETLGFLEKQEQEEDVDSLAAVEAHDTEPRLFPALKEQAGIRSFRPSPAVGDIAIPQETTSQTQKQSKAAASKDEHTKGLNTYNAKTSPAASGLRGPLSQESQPRSLAARWRQQQEQFGQSGIQKKASGQGALGVSFDLLRSADKVSDDTSATSKTNSTPFGLGVAADRSLGSGGTTVETGQDSAVPSAVQSKGSRKQKGKLNDVTSLLVSRQAKTHNVKAEVPAAAAAETQSAPEPENKAETTATDAVHTEDGNAHDRLANLYRVYDPSPPTPREMNVLLGGSWRPAVTIRRMVVDESLPPSERSIADLIKGGGAKQISSSTPPESPPPDGESSGKAQASSEQITSLDPSKISIKPLDIPQPDVPYLQYGLDRVLFNPGVYQLQDPASRVYNFDPYLQNIMPVADFDFNALKEYKTSSQDEALSALALKEGKRYIGSTSSMTSSLAHFHYLLSNFRLVNTAMMSHEFSKAQPKQTFTDINRAPSAVFLRWKNGTYAIDADREYDSGNVLMLLGKSMELLLTVSKNDYERYRKDDPRQVPNEWKTSPEAYQYTSIGDFLMRSQLDAYDPRLPGNGTFDLKTRAVVSVRHSAVDYERMTGYELYNLQGKWGSYEKEYYDMIRSTMLKYMLQARMGRMNGIFVAYHNVKRIFGFQYIPMHEMDRALHGQTDSCLGDQEFKASLDIMNEILNKATAKFPNQSLRFHFETRPERDDMPTALHVFAEPMADKDIDAIQSSSKEKVAAFERDVMGKEDVQAVDEDSRDEPLDVASGNVVETPPSAPTTDDEVATEVNNDEVATEKPIPTSYSTEGSADRLFLDSIGKRDSDLGPLFYATVIVQSKVDGEYIEGDRPTDLKRDQKWEIDYILKEYEITMHQWALYEDCKARRKHAFYHSDDEADEVEDKGLQKYIEFLRQMSEKSAEIRQMVDRMDAGKEVVRVEKPLAKEREAIESLDDYMAWMYGSKNV